MKAWTMVSDEAFIRLQENGRLVCDRQELTVMRDGGKGVVDAYHFMIDSMAKVGLKNLMMRYFQFGVTPLLMASVRQNLTSLCSILMVVICLRLN
jgi:hypothetical protein